MAPDIVTQAGDGPIGVFPKLMGNFMYGPPQLEHNPPGLYAWGIESSLPGNAWDHGAWAYSVPRYYSDLKDYGELPQSFISYMWLSQVYFQGHSNYVSPMFAAGLWRGGSNPGWRSIVSHEGTEGHGLTDFNYVYGFNNKGSEGESPDVKQALFGLFVGEPIPHELAALYAGYAAVELSEPLTVIPKFGTPLAGPSQWVNTQAKPVEFVASDNGLGVYSITATPDSVSGTSWKTEYGCTGAGSQPCPHTWKSTDPGRPPLAYDPSKLPNGVNKLSLVAESPTGRASSAVKVQVKVDHQSPATTLSGSLTEQAKLGTIASEYKLNYASSDGDSSTPAALSSFGGAGTAEGKTQRPTSIAVSATGDLYVLDRDNNRVEKFDSTGKFLMQFGSAGSGNGQFKEPRGIAIAPNGDLWIADYGNARVQHFNSSGVYQSQFGTKGTNGGTQFVKPYGIAVVKGTPQVGEVPIIYVSDLGGNRVGGFFENGSFIGNVIGSSTNPSGPAVFGEPSGIAVDGSKNLWVADAQNNRVQKFSPEGKFLLQSGTTGSGSGQFAGPMAVAAAPSGNVLVADGDNNRIEEFRPDGTFVRSFGSIGSGLAQMSEPRGLAIGPGNFAYVADAGNHRVDKWAHGSYDPQSGVVSTEVKVDGKLVEPKYSPGCATESCSVSKEWSLKANGYATGAHTVEVKAVDGANLSSTKTLTVNTVNDTVPPQLSPTGAVFTAPEGWLEQKAYPYSVTATDIGGYGVTALSLKIDGSSVAASNAACPNGGCSRTISGSLNANSYSGGAHAAELIATDGAGLTKKQTWTMNIDPDGTISSGEAEDTLEAADATSESEIVAANSEIIPAEERADGNNPALEAGGEGIESSGTPNLSFIDADPADGFDIGVPDSTIEVDPLNVSAAALSPTVVHDSAALAANTQQHVDTIIRPVYNGIMSYESIRDVLGPETYSWELDLREGQTVKALDSKDAEIDFSDGTAAMLITAEAAHDAIGTPVPTTLSVSGGNIITLKVEHRSKAFVYPVVSGSGWQGVYTTQFVAAPMDELEIYEARKKREEEAIALRESEEWAKWDKEVQEFEEGKGPAYEHQTSPYHPVGHDRVGPPRPLPDNETDDQGATASSGAHRHELMPFEYDLYAWEVPDPFDFLDEIPWHMTHWGFFEYNGSYAWWKASKPHPHCEHEARLATVSLEYCDWIGLNHQPYGAGRHISSQARYFVNPFGVPADMPVPVTEYMYGDGYANGHNTEALCNPLSTC